jgi:CheY-like chemotaxis protein
LFSGRAFDKGIDIAAHIGPGVPPVIQGDPIRLRQVFSNLVNNAVKFTDRGAVLLAVQVAKDAGPQPMLEFSVSDTGVGVPPEEQQRVFDAFEQADDSVTRKFGGTGLGLAICRQLVELMDGRMGLTSVPGGGSRFSFVIPADVPKSEVAAVAPTTDALAREMAREMAIVAGMHPVIGAAAGEVIGAQCGRVVSVDTVDAAIEALRKAGPPVARIRLFIDSAIAGDLEQAARRLHASAAPRQLEVTALLPPDAETTPIAGVQRCLIKPLCTPDLVAAIAETDAAQSSRVRALPASGSRGRALVVEDNAVNQEMARAMLDMLGFEVITASNGLEGVSAATDPNLVLILMDCQMPVMDGLAAARAIRAAEPVGRHVPIIALTGNAMPGDREACVAAGMDDYLAKPFSLTALRGILDRWTGPATG